ncbi:MAG TPA: energy transducer TonB [Lacunisphaera sp.]|nr:energy transducer TonB [Lacunisphaera sp.]
MNIERYKLPAIIAASLHGALFLVIPDTTIGDTTVPDNAPEEWVQPVVNDPFPVELITPEEGDSNPAAPGGPSLPSLPDPPPSSLSEFSFTVPVTKYVPALDVIRDLASYRGEPPGPGMFGDPGRMGIPGVANLDRPPRAMVQPAPTYPTTLRNDGISGSVTVEFVVDTAGRVVTADAVKWSHREFVEPAIRAVLRWRFEPGTMEGRKVRFRMAVPIEFSAER